MKVVRKKEEKEFLFDHEMEKLTPSAAERWSLFARGQDDGNSGVWPVASNVFRRNVA